MEIKHKLSDGKVCLGCDELGVYDFGDTLDEAKNNFKKAAIMMIDSKLDAVVLTSETEEGQ